MQLALLPKITFAKNDISFIDPSGVDDDTLGRALNKALYNYMHGIGLEQDLRSWFDGKRQPHWCNQDLSQTRLLRAERLAYGHF